MSDLSDYRKSYEKSVLLESCVDENPMMQFKKWFYEIEDFGGVDEVNAMTVSTIGLDGFPKSRVVLLKSYDEEGFVFYTNYNSEKGKAIIANPHLCLSFFWPSAERQIIIKGIASKASAAQSDNYFNSRPLGSRLGAIVSNQSEVIPNHQVLEDAINKLEKEATEDTVKRPDNWGGFVVKPVSIEFWQGRANRLHDRIRYTLTEDGLDWKIERLAP
ncbi:pyridoxamine 5'-phosphate oxidase [Myroides odoratimimus]|uniref:Pyridoxine/pyridoxamine 5'-phosphate oxidase n=2 Tax=Myroides odoratimimus TaxID=76832 RepID=A0AAI8C825_9FLAO|nr:pyridoxamine 5'-phosphate oxidase [Myroides odoratimimus]ALU27852.1 pyridoxamine 5'-phosphate oxidase [Myroides odoratimimus]EHO10410.1 pyridoxamine 5'-phosphate oxidase [Myroides odoratimimus CCUG 10230]MCA4794335.1 pyridoxamine 5'-phosphate oxidase [Myroides odoratimimus]MCA4821596.1 pyridoxamine 5'-phosphate oxidase [Myroides odoratimimus]MDM1060539.1 pyridoxamine 5'-phosphate oxidase [Myroides odoratimimus]